MWWVISHFPLLMILSLAQEVFLCVSIIIILCLRKLRLKEAMESQRKMLGAQLRFRLVGVFLFWGFFLKSDNVPLLSSLSLYKFINFILKDYNSI